MWARRTDGAWKLTLCRIRTLKRPELKARPCPAPYRSHLAKVRDFGALGNEKTLFTLLTRTAFLATGHFDEAHPLGGVPSYLRRKAGGKRRACFLLFRRTLGRPQGFT